MYAIEARGLTKSFRGVRAVDGLDLVVDEGEIVALLGPNGAGKTTTLMMLLGITEPDSGWVRLLGHALPKDRAAALAQTNFTASYIGMPHRIKVREILEVFCGLYGVPETRIDHVVSLFAIDHLVNRNMSQLSSGQRTLVGLAKSLLNQPRLLILDEPTASLDPEVATRIRDVLAEVRRDAGFTMLITSHNMAEIERMCQRVVFIAHGRVVADGSPSQIAESYGVEDLEETFLSIAAQARSESQAPTETHAAPTLPTETHAAQSLPTETHREPAVTTEERK
jgi:ABC-2 type transport system ATP-binding protein